MLVSWFESHRYYEALGTTKLIPWGYVAKVEYSFIFIYLSFSVFNCKSYEMGYRSDLMQVK